IQATITGTQAGIAVSPAAAKTFTVAGFSSPTTAGTSHSFTVAAKDPYGNIATGYSGTVHFTSSDRQAVLPGNYTFVAGDAGVHAFSATLKPAGTQSITARDTATSTIAGSQTGIKVNPAAVSQLKVIAPTTATAGPAFTFTVTATEPSGDKATGYRGTVHFTSSDAQGVLPADYTFTATDNGAHSFSSGATLKTAGTQSLTATDTVTAA